MKSEQLWLEMLGGFGDLHGVLLEDRRPTVQIMEGEGGVKPGMCHKVTKTSKLESNPVMKPMTKWTFLPRLPHVCHSDLP